MLRKVKCCAADPASMAVSYALWREFELDCRGLIGVRIAAK